MVRSIRSGGAEEVAPEDDLVVRAARALQQASATSLGASLRIVKRIPMGAGLGGGSSDAATTLLALNRLWKCALPPAKLAELGIRLGADVPVFLAGSSAWAEGRGEKLTPVELAVRWYLVICPGVSVEYRRDLPGP